MVKSSLSGGGTAAWQPPSFGAPLLYATNIKHLLLTEKHNLSHSDVFHAIRILRLCTVTLEVLWHDICCLTVQYCVCTYIAVEQRVVIMKIFP